MNDVDENKDGKISFNEFSKLMQRFGEKSQGDTIKYS